MSDPGELQAAPREAKAAFRRIEEKLLLPGERALRRARREREARRVYARPAGHAGGDALLRRPAPAALSGGAAARGSVLGLGGGEDRLTFDSELRYHRAAFGPLGGSLSEGIAEGAAVVEVKRRSPLPDWAALALGRVGAAPAVGFSKFERAV
jgi:hypothetical protein